MSTVSGKVHDAVLGFEHKEEAERFLRELRERVTKFGLELHSEKTRLIEFDRYAGPNRERRGEGKPETFDFLGFTYMYWKNGSGAVTLTGAAIGDRLVAVFGAPTAGGALEANAPGTDFEAAVTVADQIQQVTAGNLSTMTYVFILIPAAA